MARVIPAPPTSKEKLENLTTFCLSKWQPEALISPQPVDIERIFEDFLEKEYEVKTGYDDLPEDVEGVTDGKRMIARVDLNLYRSYDIGDQTGIRRCRSTSAHETGHCVLHIKSLNAISSITTRDQAQLFRVDQSQLKPFVDPEWQAWYFAGALLMPREMIFTAIEEVGKSPHRLADVFDVNPGFVKVRLKRLKLI